MPLKTHATIDDLHRVRGKAEVVNGEVVHMSPTGDDPNYAGFEIAVSLREFARQTKRGRAVTDNAAFRVRLPNRNRSVPTPLITSAHEHE